ncbi:hypothetical protein DFH07DRAFT_210240 [Mycena maculata]|uniref:Uncharacterized protein n=1 Tax=Mycena maculata TaxID=230809 RepID=A0AAD7KEH1_9AGAR|nr:hypothetical protein DFH07DRAFT_210240 [Mycena maculata]
MFTEKSESTGDINESCAGCAVLNNNNNNNNDSGGNIVNDSDNNNNNDNSGIINCNNANITPQQNSDSNGTLAIPSVLSCACTSRPPELVILLALNVFITILLLGVIVLLLRRRRLQRTPATEKVQDDPEDPQSSPTRAVVPFMTTASEEDGNARLGPKLEAARQRNVELIRRVAELEAERQAPGPSGFVDVEAPRYTE